MRIIEMPSSIITNILNMNSAMKSLQLEYKNKPRGNIFNKRFHLIHRKLLVYKGKLEKYNEYEVNLWKLQVSKVNTQDVNIQKTIKIYLDAELSKHEVSSLVSFKFNYIVHSIYLLDTIQLGKEKKVL